VDSLGQVLVAIVTTLGTIAVAYIGAKTGRLPGLNGGPKADDLAALRERLEVEEAKSEVWQSKYEAEVIAHASTTERAEYAEREADACERRLNNLYTELNRSGQVADRRTPPRGGAGDREVHRHDD
jgi:hypothetical protein